MKNLLVNPYLPGWEYVPDGEPHVFGKRLYVFGSHDKAHGQKYCQEDYVVWSTPIEDLSQWTCHGISYRKDQDPHNRDGSKELWAPDVCQGSDGRYYMYYCLAFIPEIAIAVSSKPEGPYEFYDYIRDKNGDIWSEDLPFDPGVLYEDKDHIWLYTGFGADPIPKPESIQEMRKQDHFKEESDQTLELILDQLKALSNTSTQCTCLRLDSDMKTIRETSPIAPVHRNAEGSSFEEHPFFEASSIRKINDLYYLVYSSYQGNELCYATSKYPDKDFVFGGVIISNGDIGYKRNVKPRAYIANNHGGLVEVEGQWYIFYHRHTNGRQFSRQGCAEPVSILSDGSIQQVEMTSSGLYGKSLPANRIYSAHICCNLMGPSGAHQIEFKPDLPVDMPRITEEYTGTDRVNQFVYNLRTGAVCGAKYFAFQGENSMVLQVRGQGILEFHLDDEGSPSLGQIHVDSLDWQEVRIDLEAIEGVHGVFFSVKKSEGGVDISEFGFEALE